MLLVIRQPAVPGGPIRVAFSLGDAQREVTGEVVRTTSEGMIGIEVPESDAEALEDVIRWSAEPPTT
jgi:hypothetical protein